MMVKQMETIEEVLEGIKEIAGEIYDRYEDSDASIYGEYAYLGAEVHGKATWYLNSKKHDEDDLPKLLADVCDLTSMARAFRDRDCNTLKDLRDRLETLMD